MIAIAAAAVFDFWDGALARMLHAYSNIGKDLDSLSDLVSFGVAPAALMAKHHAPLRFSGMDLSVCPFHSCMRSDTPC